MVGDRGRIEGIEMSERDGWKDECSMRIFVNQVQAICSLLDIVTRKRDRGDKGL